MLDYICKDHCNKYFDVLYLENATKIDSEKGIIFCFLVYKR